MTITRRSFTAGITALGGFLGLSKAAQASESPCDHPMIFNLKDDRLASFAILKTHEFVNARTGAPLSAPEGVRGIYYASELTGLCRYYKQKRTPEGFMVGYSVISGTDREPTREEPHAWEWANGHAMPRTLESAWGEFTAMVRFVPRKGLEREAASVRAAYAAMEVAIRESR